MTVHVYLEEDDVCAPFPESKKIATLVGTLRREEALWLICSWRLLFEIDLDDIEDYNENHFPGIHSVQDVEARQALGEEYNDYLDDDYD